MQLSSNRDVLEHIHDHLVQIDRKLDAILGRQFRNQEIIMSRISDANATLDSILSSTAEETDILTAIASGVDAIKAQNVSLAQQLADAIANGAPPEEVDALIAKLASLNNAIDGQKLAENAIKNTLADTATPPEPTTTPAPVDPNVPV